MGNQYDQIELPTPSSARTSAARQLDDDPIMNRVLEEVIADDADRQRFERPQAPIPVTKLTAESDEEILAAMKDYAEYDLVSFMEII